MKKSGQHGAKGHTAKHGGTSKHHAHHHLKHHPKKPAAPVGHGLGGAPRTHVVAKHPHHAKGLALGDALPVCTVEALAMSLRLAGQPVGEDEVAHLWELAGGRELEIAEALEAAARFGLAGARPQWLDISTANAALAAQVRTSAIDQKTAVALGLMPASVILGMDVPGPHAVLATPDGWWSWGELWSPWTTAIDEAWAVSWS